ncbi:unnamed protein product, partial [Discosporangium mesarthrocarpum]
EDLVFPDFNALEAYCEAELKAWEWLPAASAQAGQVKQFADRAVGVYSHTKSLISAYGEKQQRDQKKQLANKIRGQVNNFGRTPESMLSSDPRAKYAKSLNQEGNPTVAAWTWLAFLQPAHVETNSPEAVSGLVLALMFQNALTARRADQEASALGDVRRTWDEFSSESKGEYEKFREDYLDLKRTVEDLREGQSQAFGEMLEEKQAELEAVTNTYDQKLALKAPVDYWEKRAIAQRERAWRYATAAGWGLALVVAVLLGASRALLPEVWDADFDVTKIPYGRVLLMLGLGTLLIWPVRVLSRMLLSALHLHTDAEERVTLVNTYLSLLRDEAGLTEGEKELILNALFRQAATGIVRDDGLGGASNEALSRVLSR